MDLKWEWFCGVNSSYLDESMNWYDDFRNNTCLVNGLVTIPHAAFLLLSSLVLLVLGCCTGYRRIQTKYLLVYPGHSVRWLLSMLLLVLVLASIGEGVLTDETYQAWQQPTQPHLYVPGIVAFVAVALSLVYCHHMELWQLPAMSLLLLPYWLFSLANEALRAVSLQHQGAAEVHVVIFDLTLIKLVIYVALLLIEANVIRIKLCGQCREASEFPGDLWLPDMLYMHYYVSLFSALTYWWLNWLLSLGYRKSLELDDLGVVPAQHEARFNHERFKKAFLEESERADRRGGSPSLGRVYRKVYGRRLFAAAVLKLVGELFGFVNPVAVGALTAFATSLNVAQETPPSPAHYATVNEFFKNGFVLVALMLVSSMINFFCLQTHYYLSIMEGVNARAALQAMVYEKALRLSTVATTGGKMDMGQITNHMSVDPNAIQVMFQNINNLWCIPIQIIVNLVLLYLEMGYAALIGASVFLLLSPIQFKIATMISRRQKQMMVCSDERLEKTNELLQGMKLLKLYAWEGLYGRAIEAVRGRELDFLLKINVLMIATILLTSAAPVLVNVVGFGTYSALTGEPLTPEVTFAALSLFNMLTMPLLMLPMSLLYLVNGLVSGRRLVNFLLAAEVEADDGSSASQYAESDTSGGSNDAAVSYRSQSDHVIVTTSASETEDARARASSERSSLLTPRRARPRAKGLRYGAARQTRNRLCPAPDVHLRAGVAIRVSHGNFVWDPESGSRVLSDINLEIPEGKLTVVIGQVGSGKSSLLAALLGEMTTVSGLVQRRENATIAFAAQKAWLLNDSLQENILFAEQLNSRRYRRVIDACSLRPDIDILPGGDQTEIGEKGINLSGGQKQRVSVARAMYSGRDIVILDDPLSALDVHVGRHLFEAGILKLLTRRKVTVILVTHQLQYLNQAHLIVEMKDGRIAAQGSLDDIIAADPAMYSEFDKTVKAATESEAEAELSGVESEGTTQERLRLQRQVKRHFLTKQLSKGGDSATASGALIEQEEMERGSVSLGVYLYYAANVGWLLILAVVLMAVLDAGLGIGTNFWLSAWSEAGLGNETDPLTAEYYGGFVGLSISSLVARLLSMVALIAAILVAARRIHQRVLRNIIKAPLRFFDMTPIGRILNRFSNDTQLIDVRLTQTINMLVNTVLRVASAVVVNAIVMPIIMAFYVPLAIVFYFIQSYFLASSRELQRLDSISKSPVFAYYSESLGGLTTIRAYEATERFYDTIIERINANLTAFLYLQAVTRWLGLRLDFIAATLVTLAGMTTLVGAITIDLDSSLVGLAVSYSLQVATFLNFVVRAVAELEMQMNAVERIKHYTFVENEPYDGFEPPAYWPKRGHIEMTHVSARYARNTEPVLNDVTVKFRAGEKVGVCGRTGAGKSSLTLALLRVIDIFDGSILIDGVDIKSVPLTTLRSKISIIPQDPVLFTGTVRKNLDPIGSASTDEELWSALAIAQLQNVVTALDNGLDSEVTEGGENFSVGQRQLFCLARAFLRKSRILIMDEATASIDLETDKILQQVVASAFADRTVLTIAHRITTILDSDTILVLDEGRVAEYGSPEALLDKDGLFASFVRERQL